MVLEVAAIPFVSADVETIRSTAGEYGVVRLNEPIRSPSVFVDLLRALGEPMFTVGEIPVEGFPELNLVTNKGRDKPPVSRFHTDTSYVHRPPAYTALMAVEVPQYGGATLFTDQYAAAETLDPALRTRLSGAGVLHAATGVSDATQTWQPLFREHPETRRTALFLSTQARMTRLRLRNASDSRELLKTLYIHSTEGHVRYKHQWAIGDVLIWDNRCTMHAADHSKVVGNRTLYRGMVRGEIPLWA